ncbi:MAG: hypothetical protein Fur0020_07940 [Thermodesulfovibrionia bacterium]
MGIVVENAFGKACQNGYLSNSLKRGIIVTKGLSSYSFSPENTLKVSFPDLIRESSFFYSGLSDLST